eukprot:scaffold300_cov258-Pinguiococcus_pyrenoidosus.AAC.73
MTNQGHIFAVLLVGVLFPVDSVLRMKVLIPLSQRVSQHDFLVISSLSHASSHASSAQQCLNNLFRSSPGRCQTVAVLFGGIGYCSFNRWRRPRQSLGRCKKEAGTISDASMHRFYVVKLPRQEVAVLYSRLLSAYA